MSTKSSQPFYLSDTRHQIKTTKFERFIVGATFLISALMEIIGVLILAVGIVPPNPSATNIIFGCVLIAAGIAFTWLAIKESLGFNRYYY